MATLVCAPFSKWRHTPKSLATILKMAVVRTRRHFENGHKIVATAGAPLTIKKKPTAFQMVTVQVDRFSNGDGASRQTLGQFGEGVGLWRAESAPCMSW